MCDSCWYIAMETLPNVVKRKKRKTRKCLDEIRKRSRRTGQVLLEKHDNKVCDLFSNYNNMNNCLITSNRLTLRMFPKAIRSETITRPELEDLKQKPNLNLDEMVKGTKVLNMLNSSQVDSQDFINTFDNSIEHLKNENLKLTCNKYGLERSVNSEKSGGKTTVSQEENLSVNLDLFSSMDSTEVTDKSPDSIGAQSVSIVTTSSNQSLHDDYRYNLYEEFMSEIPTYLKQNATFVEEDVMKKTKMFLQNLFLESCYKECEDNVLRCIKNNNKKIYCAPSEIIVNNPMDYIRLSHAQQQSFFHQSSRIGETNTEVRRSNCSNPHSPLIAPRSVAASPDTPLSVIVHTTPDYTFYPHRLN